MQLLSILSLTYLSFSDAFMIAPSVISRTSFHSKPIHHVTHRLDTRSSMVIDPETIKHVIVKAVPWVIGYGVTMTVLNSLSNGANMMNFPGSGNGPGTISTDTSVTMDDVAGIDHIKTEIEEIISFMKNPEAYDAIGAKMVKGILLIGQPGTGKTLTARAIASESDCPLISVNGAEFVNTYVGMGANNIRKLFKKARDVSPCIIFIDEIDSLCGKRGIGAGGGNDERDACLNQFLTELSGVNRDNDNILVIGATNRLDMLDSAAIRPGRFDRKLTIQLPNKEERVQVLKVHAKNKKMDKDIDLEAIAKATVTKSPAFLANVLNEAAILAVRNNRKSVSQIDLEEALEKNLIGIRLPNRKVSEKTERLVSIHEAGHTVAALVFGKTVSRVSCIPSSGSAAGYTMILPTEDDDSAMPNSQSLVHELIILASGNAAEKQINGDASTGWISDLTRMKQLASTMIDDVGFGPTAAVTGSDGEAQIVSLINQCCDTAFALIGDNLPLLGEITDALVEKRELRQEELYDLVDKFVKNGGELKGFEE